MKLKVGFREYCNPEIDHDTGEQERGEYIGSFSREVDGSNIEDILNNSEQMAKELSQEYGTDVRVTGVAVTITPRGIRQ